MNRQLTIAIAVFACFTASSALAAGEKDKRDKIKMLPQPATTQELRVLTPGRFGDRPPDEAFGAYQRGLYLTAYNLALPQAEKGDAASQALVAEIYARGLGIAADQKKAAQWYQKAAEQGVNEAQFRYAALLLQGTFVKKDAAQAEILMQKAAEGGNPMAQFNYAQMLMMKSPGAAGLDQALPWFEKAAASKLADAEYAVSQIYAHGTDKIAKDPAKSQQFLLRAAQRGYDTAQYDLGRSLVEGSDGHKDYDLGFRWVKVAAQRGVVEAQALLARLYRDGLGTEGDTVTAAAWYMVARRAGYKSADLDDLMDGLADEQIKRATELTKTLR